MNTQVIVTISGPDKAGILRELSRQTHGLQGRWLDSKLSQLEGQMVGLIKLDIPQQNLAALKEQFASQPGMSFSYNEPDPEAHHGQLVTLTFHGTDKPGLVNDLSHALHDIGVYILHMDCHRLGVPELGSAMFSAELKLKLPDNIEYEMVTEHLAGLNAEASIEIHA